MKHEYGYLRVLDGGFGNNSTGDDVALNSVSASLTTNVSINSAFPTYADVTGLAVTFTTTRVNQPVIISLTCTVLGGASTSYAGCAYKINSGSYIGLAFLDRVAGTSGTYANLSCTIPWPPTAIGTYTIQIGGVNGTAAVNFLGASSAPEAQSTLTAVY